MQAKELNEMIAPEKGNYEILSVKSGEENDISFTLANMKEEYWLWEGNVEMNIKQEMDKGNYKSLRFGLIKRTKSWSEIITELKQRIFVKY